MLAPKIDKPTLSYDHEPGTVDGVRLLQRERVQGVVINRSGGSNDIRYHRALNHGMAGAGLGAHVVVSSYVKDTDLTLKVDRCIPDGRAFHLDESDSARALSRGI